MALQCNTCGGVYEPILPDGSQYFHACPPVTKLKVRNLDTSTSLVDPGKEGIRPVLDVVAVERTGKRDENAVQGEPGKLSAIKAEGTGTRVVAS